MPVLTDFDIKLFYEINVGCSNKVLDMIMAWVTEIGGGIALFALGFVLVLIGRKHARITGILLLAGLTMSYYFAKLIKEFVARPRPFMVLDDMKMLLTADGYSFVSHHATTVFMAAYILSKTYGKWYIFYTLAAIVAFSRVYLGVHYPFDVLAGAFLGTVIGAILFRATGEVR